MATKTRRLADFLENIDDDSKVTSAGLLDATIAAADIADGSITAAKLGSGAVTEAKLNADVTNNERAEGAKNPEEGRALGRSFQASFADNQAPRPVNG